MKSLSELQEECEVQLDELLESDLISDKQRKRKIQSFLESLEDVIQERIDLALHDKASQHEY